MYFKMSVRRPVKRLDPTVVNRIAAGEVVKRPANALKEMLENCLDAESTCIQVIVKDGGMKFLQIQDNGVGIPKDDLPVVCERFTTSKLESFDDLRSINTYGFRGEALSSISHVSHVTITTKTDDERCGYKALYVDGRMKGTLVPCGVNRGTQITVENMFHNVPTRHRMLKNLNEEFTKIKDVVSRYAIHNSSVSFSLKKYGRDELHVKTQPNSTCIDNIRSIFGNVIARDLMETEETDETLHMKFHVLSTNLDYRASQLTFLLFINHRLVDAEGLRKDLDLLYGLHLPQGMHPFIYISLEMAPENVDVNVHPTKHSVFYLHEEAINKKIRTAVQQLIVDRQGARSFTIQPFSMLSLTNPLAHETTQLKNKAELYPYEKVRVDASEQKIDRFLQPLSKTDVPDSIKGYMNLDLSTCTVSEDKTEGCDIEDEVSANFILERKEEEKRKKLTCVTNSMCNTISEVNTSSNSNTECNNSKTIQVVGSANDLQLDNIHMDTHPNLHPLDCTENTDLCDGTQCVTEESNVTKHVEEEPEIVKSNVLAERRELLLTSLERLRKKVVDDCDAELKRVLRSASYVGLLENQYMLMQHSTNLYLCVVKDLCEAFFYQLMLCEFGNFGVLQLSQPISLVSLLIRGTNGVQSEAESLCQLLLEKRDMLEDYFSIKIDQNGNLLGFPWLLQQFYPSVSYLPDYILKLVTEVNWKDEQACFHGICQVTASFYSQIPTDESQLKNARGWKWTLEHILFPQIKKNVYPPKSFIRNLSLCHLTRFKDLFTVFERC